jgi:cell division protein FtsB
MKLSKRVKNNWFIGIIILIALFLLLNRGARTIIKHLADEKRLKAGIERLEQENASLKSQIYNLEHNQAFLIRAVKNEYKVIADGEIEYRFNVK